MKKLILINILLIIVACSNHPQDKVNNLKQDSLKREQESSINLNHNIKPNGKCDTKYLAYIDSLIKYNNLTTGDISGLFETISDSCNNNAEFGEFSNEILFKSLSKHPKIFVEQLSKENQTKQTTIINELKTPVTEEFDLENIINKIQDTTTSNKLQNIIDLKTKNQITKNNKIRKGFVKMDTIPTPKRIKEKVNDNIKLTIQTDFTGNNKADYIAITKADKFGNYKDYWINSDFQIIKINNYSADAQYFIRLVNIDNDKEPEIFYVEHYPEGTDYCFKDDIISNDERILLYFTPIYQRNDKNYYAYPTDIDDIIIRQSDNTVEFKVAIKHGIIRDGNITFPDNQKGLPALFFKEKIMTNKKQSYEEKGVMKIEWMKFDEIIKRIRK